MISAALIAETDDDSPRFLKAFRLSMDSAGDLHITVEKEDGDNYAGTSIPAADFRMFLDLNVSLGHHHDQ